MFKQVEQICAEFKVRALKYHPDKNAGDKTAEETFQKLNVSAPTICIIHNDDDDNSHASLSLIYAYIKF